MAANAKSPVKKNMAAWYDPGLLFGTGIRTIISSLFGEFADKFSVAAYRLGHSMIRGGYHLNGIVRGIPIFRPNAGPLQDLRGFRPLPEQWTIDWNLYVRLDGDAAQVQMSRKIDSRLASALSQIPPSNDSLARLNLLRGFRMSLPSGQEVARAMGLQPRSNAELGIDSSLAGTEAPLWLYILKEAELGGGEKLGPVGARIVAEVFVGLAAHDPHGFIRLEPHWSPATAINGQPLVPLKSAKLQLHHLIRAAGRDVDPFP
jgi:hypothetical protein